MSTEKTTTKVPTVEEEIVELEDCFDDWFAHLLHQQETCLYRYVLRECRKELKVAFVKWRPVWTSKEIAESRIEAAKMMEVLKDE